MSSPEIGGSTAVKRDNGDVARLFLEAIYANDFERAFAEYAHPSYRFVVSSLANPDLTAAIPWAGRVHVGRDGYQELTRQLFAEFEPVSFEARRFTATAERVFVEGHFTFRHRLTAKIADSDWLARFDFADGRIVGGQFYENTYAIAAARR
jgi:ketosteroid isomerase-like protein